MRQFAALAVLLALASLPARCTAVLVYRTPSKIVIGADSTAPSFSAADTGSECKITKSGAVYVSTVGFVSNPDNGFDSLVLASKAIAHSRGIVAAARRFADLSKAPLEEAMRAVRRQRRSAYETEIRTMDPVMSVLFAGIEDGLPTFAIVNFFHSQNASKPMAVMTRLDFCPGNACDPGRNWIFDARAAPRAHSSGIDRRSGLGQFANSFRGKSPSFQSTSVGQSISLPSQKRGECGIRRQMSLIVYRNQLQRPFPH